MGVIGDAITQPLPTVGVTTGPTWASEIVDFLTEVQTRLEALVDSSSILLTTGDVKHVTRYLSLAAAMGMSTTATWTGGTGGTAAYWLGAGAANTVEFPIPMDRNRRITAVSMTGRSTGTAWTWRLWKIDRSASTRTQISTTQTSGTGTTIETLPITGLTETVAAGFDYVAEWTSGAVSTRCLGIEIAYDRQVAT